MITNVRLGLGLLACGAALAYGGAASAQTAGSGAGAPGAPTATDRFSLDVHAHTTYESNVAGGDRAVATLRELKPADIIYNLGAAVAFQLPSSRHTLFLTGAVDFDRYDKNKILNADNYEVSAGGSNRFGSCFATAVAAYAHRQGLIQDLTVAATKNVVEQASANGGVKCGRRSIFAGLDGGVTKVTNNGTGAIFIDSETRRAVASLGYQNRRLGDVALFAQYSEVDYQNVPVTVPPSPTGYTQSGIGVSYARKIGNRLNGKAGVNYTKLDAKGSSFTSDALGADVDLNYRVSPRLALALHYSLGNEPSPVADAAFVRTEAFRFSGDYKLNSRIGLQAGIAKSRDKYRGVPATIFQIGKSEDTTVYGGATVKIGRKISMTLDASHIDRTADQAQFNYKSNRVSLGIIGNF